MAQLPYANLVAAGDAALVERIVAERGSLLHLYQMLRGRDGMTCEKVRVP